MPVAPVRGETGEAKVRVRNAVAIRTPTTYAQPLLEPGASALSVALFARAPQPRFSDTWEIIDPIASLA